MLAENRPTINFTPEQRYRIRRIREQSIDYILFTKDNFWNRYNRLWYGITTWKRTEYPIKRFSRIAGEQAAIWVARGVESFAEIPEDERKEFARMVEENMFLWVRQLSIQAIRA